MTSRHTKHTSRSASTNYKDDADYIKAEVVPRFAYALSLATCGLITPGTRCLYFYPEPADIGCVFFPNGAGRARWGFGCFNPILYYGKDPYMSGGLGGRPNSVSATHWNSEDVDHPCPKPVPWMEWMVRRGSLDGWTILDPFMGSGTTGVAAVKLGRKFIGIEIEPKYCEIAKRRIIEAEDSYALFEPPTKRETAMLEFAK